MRDSLPCWLVLYNKSQKRWSWSFNRFICSVQRTFLGRSARSCISENSIEEERKWDLSVHLTSISHFLLVNHLFFWTHRLCHPAPSGHWENQILSGKHIQMQTEEGLSVNELYEECVVHEIWGFNPGPCKDSHCLPLRCVPDQDCIRGSSIWKACHQ